LSRAVCFTDPSGALRVGALDGETVRDAGAAGPAGFVPTAEAWRSLAAASGTEYALADVELKLPVVPGKLVCIGLNYRDHAEETGAEIPSLPMVFAKFTSALIGPGETIVIPYDEPRTDYEAELALVIGTRVRRAKGAAALAAIGGITAFNDVSGREAQFAPGRQFTRGKSFDTFAPLGPCVASVDGLDLGALRVSCTLSGEVLQDSSTANLIFGVQELVEFCSAAFTLEPGDVIATGTPPGVGDARTPPRYLQDGDVVEIEVEGVGVLSNPCVAEQRPR
jgi:2-keto-4-pentenoate hydratase/2-oxohepta-3-ene-1,7-dioic acid hydratase in catechol pathway